MTKILLEKLILQMSNLSYFMYCDYLIFDFVQYQTPTLS